MTEPTDVKVVCVPSKALHTQDTGVEAKAFAAGAQAMLEHMALHVAVFIRTPIQIVAQREFETSKEWFDIQWRVGAIGGTPGKTMLALNSPDQIYGLAPPNLI